MRRIKRYLIPVMIFIGLFIMFRYILFIGFVPSMSMEPTIKSGSIIIASRFFYDIQTDDIIIFYHDNKVLVKRVVAIGGEVFKMNDQEYVVPFGKFIVLGDNHTNSFDSRYWDDPYVNECDIIAKVINK